MKYSSETGSKAASTCSQYPVQRSAIWNASRTLPDPKGVGRWDGGRRRPPRSRIGLAAIRGPVHELRAGSMQSPAQATPAIGLGLAMAQQCLEAGHRVLTISRRPAELPSPAGAELEQWSADLAEPAPVAARLQAWLAAQAIHVRAPGMATLEHLEADVAALDRPSMALSEEEGAAVERWRRQVDLETCRICDKVCQAVCERGLSIDWLIYHNVFQNELRRLGVEGFMDYPFAPWVKQHAEFMFTNTVATLENCTHCGKCEEACPHGLPVMDLMERIREEETALIEELSRADWTSQYQGSRSPMPEQALAAWISGGKPRRR